MHYWQTAQLKHGDLKAALLGGPLPTSRSGLGNVVAIAAGGYHTLALKSDSTVVAWGAGETNNAQFGNDGQSIVPVGLSNVVAIAAGGYDSLALQADGKVVCWGNNGYRQNDLPVGLTGVQVIGSGTEHSLAIRSGQLTPVILEEPTDQSARAGGTVTFSSEGVGVAGVQYQWQFNNVDITNATNATLTLMNVSAADEGSYQVVISDSAGSVTSDAATFTLLPEPQLPQILLVSPAAPSTNWIATNLTLSVAATDNDPPLYPLSYYWQFNGASLGYNNTSSNTIVPYGESPIYFLDGDYTLIVSNAAGITNVTWTIRTLEPGTVAAWGDDTYGECDRPATLISTIGLAAGEYHSVAVTENGSVAAWGDDTYGQTNVPANLTNAIAVAAGYLHTLALLNNGNVVAWGNNAYNQTNVPTNVTNAIAVAAGGWQSLALLQNGTVVQWGQTNAPIPAGLTNVTAIACGTNFCLALLTNTTVVAWGVNNSGQTNVPTNLTNAVAIAAGGAHALALLQNGTIMAWGDNNYGETNVPANLTNAMAVAAGDAHCVALRNDGTVVCWGDNSAGQRTCSPIYRQSKCLPPEATTHWLLSSRPLSNIR